jgi:Domain of unknown function (DUF4166)
MPQPPIFQSIFFDWHALPSVIQKHYANRGYSRDVVIATGYLDIEVSWFAKLLSPFMRMTGTLAPIAGTNVPVQVRFESEPDSNAFCLDRIFNYPNRKHLNFRSRMVPQGGNEVIEFTNSGIGWHATFDFENGKVKLRHVGYKMRIFKMNLKLPLELIIGRGYAEEWALNEDHFKMRMTIRHPLFGLFYAYNGEFKITEVNLND